jgi:hypothetical protein
VPIKPATGDLLNTIIASTAVTNTLITSTWPGSDRGYSLAGFSNNLAIGQLMLDAQGKTPKTGFYFTGTGPSNAMYVDCLVLADFASYTNRVGTNLLALSFNTNLIIYYAQALTADGSSVAEAINHFNGNHLRWVPAYAGNFSSTNLFYPDGTMITVNAALAASKDIDSNGNGIQNYSDPTPFLVSSEVALNLSVTNRFAKVQWQTIPNATNYIYYKTNLLSPAWLPFTNFNNYYYGANLAGTNAAHANWFASPQPYPSSATNVWVLDPLANAPHYYQVVVQPWLTYPY